MSEINYKAKLDKRRLCTSILAVLLLFGLGPQASATLRYDAQQQTQDSLSGDTLRDLILQARDRIVQLTKESEAAQEYIKSLEAARDKDEQLIASLRQLDQVRQDTITALNNQIAALRSALDISEKAKTDAIKEAERQTKRAARWKSIAKWGTAAGIATGAIVVLSLKK